jgi:competence protein ComEA
VVVVHVAGAVVRPGLYRLPAGSRVADAIDLAGGPQRRAELDRLNLAARLADGQRVAVSRRGEPPPPGPVEALTAAADGTTPAGPIDLNTAGMAELETLPGVGPATARKILEERTRRGGFRSVRDLLGVPGIGDRRFAELRNRVRVDGE